MKRMRIVIYFGITSKQRTMCVCFSVIQSFFIIDFGKPDLIKKKNLISNGRNEKYINNKIRAGQTISYASSGLSLLTVKSNKNLFV